VRLTTQSWNAVQAMSPAGAASRHVMDELVIKLAPQKLLPTSNAHFANQIESRNAEHNQTEKVFSKMFTTTSDK